MGPFECVLHTACLYSHNLMPESVRILGNGYDVPCPGTRPSLTNLLLLGSLKLSEWSKGG